ncbi:hypothetical protein BRYFOR_07619 [Marvinbryantia formatexigens DSM 14469]|uniref:YqzN/YkzM domain-containing protein n=1 Tax=Marvinbryantia formatexigens DSM 14469 TaxID=478749 RepID=C6LG59_9FIRM|nr:hypothetical protein [Marvinbryantia formatexigens]EET60423.1 hypothetical protein BRYFOR_07619 [Marvinbryantia formatexigens DSM 14469]UWO25237.1 hypothetical protein NQ534_01735 [Marvinbryantia formatexigens DSM 14469]SDH04900.1 hypothetical protein SAMN05660368_03751 [Marvinbryantia formatexigens]
MAEEKKEAAVSKSGASGGGKKENTGAAVYPVAELIAESERLFGTRKECAVAALKPLKAEMLDVKTAKAAVETFMKRKVR